MSIFNDPADLSEAELVAEKAHPSGSSTGLPLVCAVGLGGIGFFLTANPIVGASLAIVPLYHLARKLKENYSNHHFLRRYPGCLAHLIASEKDMVIWIEEHGAKEVAEQLLLAQKHGQTMTRTAKKAFEALLPSDLRVKPSIEAYLEQISYNPEKAVTGAIGGRTLLNAVDVKSEAVETQVETQIEDFGSADSESIDLAAHIVDNIYSYAIIGAPGSGKGFLVSHTVRLLKASMPELSIVLLDPKNDPRESGYWNGVVDYWIRKNFLDMSASEKSDWIRNSIAAYQAIEGEKLLIFDEATALFSHMKTDSKLLQEVISFLTGIASSGNSRKNFVFLVGHTPNLGDYGISSGMMSSFRKVYIARNNNLEAIQQLGNTVFCGGRFGDEVAQKIVGYANDSEIGRAVYLGTTHSWMPLEKTENYSGYDRDSGSYSNAPIEKEATDVEAEQESKPVATIENEPIDEETQILEHLVNYISNRKPMTLTQLNNNKLFRKFGITGIESTKIYLDLAVEKNLIDLNDADHYYVL